MTLPFSTARRLRVSTCKSLQARPMLVAMTSTGRSLSAEADGTILGASLKGTSAMITRRLYAAMSKEGREDRRVGVTAFWRWVGQGVPDWSGAMGPVAEYTRGCPRN